MKTPLRLLLPTTRLPAEGHEIKWNLSLSMAQLLKSLPGEEEAVICFTSDGGQWRSRHGRHSFSLVEMADNHLEEKGLHLELEVERMLLDCPLSVGDATETTRQIGRLGRAVQACLAGLWGDNTPLLSASTNPAGHTELVLEAILIGEFSANELLGQSGDSTESLPVIEGDGKVYFLPEEEVEGHGLREVAGVVGLGFLALSTQPAVAGPPNGGQPHPGVSSSSPDPQLPGFRVIELRGVQGPNRLYVQEGVLSQAGAGNVEIIVSIADQRARLYVNGQLALDTPVSTARTGKTTPVGSFSITEKVRSGKRSTIYGTSMPFWMRLDRSAIGLHVGNLPGYPASAGCIRLPPEAAERIFAAAASGTQVAITNQTLSPSTTPPILAAN